MRVFAGRVTALRPNKHAFLATDRGSTQAVARRGDLIEIEEVWPPDVRMGPLGWKSGSQFV